MTPTQRRPVPVLIWKTCPDCDVLGPVADPLLGEFVDLHRALHRFGRLLLEMFAESWPVRTLFSWLEGDRG